MSADRGYSLDCQLMLAMNGHLHSEKEKENEVHVHMHAITCVTHTHTHLVIHSTDVRGGHRHTMD